VSLTVAFNMIIQNQNHLEVNSRLLKQSYFNYGATTYIVLILLG